MKGEQDDERWTEIFHAGLGDHAPESYPEVDEDDLSIDDGLPVDDDPSVGAAYSAPSPPPRPADESWAALKTLDAIGFNQCAEEAFLALAAMLIAEGSITVPELLQEAAFELDISIATARRYLLKHTARRASLVVVRGHVQHRGPAA